MIRRYAPKGKGLGVCGIRHRACLRGFKSCSRRFSLAPAREELTDAGTGWGRPPLLPNLTCPEALAEHCCDLAPVGRPERGGRTVAVSVSAAAAILTTVIRRLRLKRSAPPQSQENQNRFRHIDCLLRSWESARGADRVIIGLYMMTTLIRSRPCQRPEFGAGAANPAGPESRSRHHAGHVATGSSPRSPDSSGMNRWREECAPATLRRRMAGRSKH